MVSVSEVWRGSSPTQLIASGLPDRCVDGLIRIDAFHLSHPHRTAQEIARLLIPRIARRDHLLGILDRRPLPGQHRRSL